MFTMLNHMRPSAVSLLESGEYRCIKAINIVYLLFTESRRDQEEGGELDSHEEIRHFAGPGEIKRKVVVLDPQVSPEEIKSREVELGLKVGLLLPQLFLNSGATDIVFVTAPHSS